MADGRTTSGIGKVIHRSLRSAASNGNGLLRSVKTRAMAGFYSGSAYRCQFCGRGFRKLRPMGAHSPALVEHEVVPPGYRLNSRCPYCGSLDRERHIDLYLKHEAGVYEHGARLRMLHFAPERNLESAIRACSGVDYVSVDLMRDAMARMDVTRLGFADEVFDAIICSHVLEHVPDDKEAMSELFRVLKPGGWAVVQVPISFTLEKTYEDSTITSPDERHRAFGQSDHLRIYGRDYFDRLRSVGFIVDGWSYTEAFSEEDAQKHGLLEGERLFICRRPSERTE